MCANMQPSRMYLSNFFSTLSTVLLYLFVPLEHFVHTRKQNRYYIKFVNYKFRKLAQIATGMVTLYPHE